MRFHERLAATTVFGALLAATFALPGAARAQQAGKWTVDARGGIAVPASDLSDLENVGGNAAVGVAYWVHPRIALRVDGSVDLLSGKDSSDQGVLVAQVPDMTLWHYVGGLEFRLTPPEATRWDVTVNLEAGATTMDTDDDPIFTTGPGGGPDFTQTYFSGNGGLRAGYWVTPRVNVFVSGQAHLIATDEQDTRVFSAFSSDVDPSGFSSGWTFPVQAGVKVSI